jgi:LacI family transcriptional regulator
MSNATPIPKYLGVSAVIEAQIQSGRWDGGKMPSVRWVAQQHKVSAVTASRALQVLRDKGLIQTVERSGCFRVPPPTADRWALALRATPGPWAEATTSVTRVGFEALARREPMHLESGLFPLAADMVERDVQALAREARAAGVRGVFLMPSRHSDAEARVDELLLTACRAEGLPVVLLERNLRGHDRPLAADLVAVDDVDAAARCTRHLLDRGRKRVAVVVASPCSSHNDRVAGYLYALHHAAATAPRRGADYKPTVLVQSDDLPSREAYGRLAEQVRKQGIDGVVCYVDYTAVGLIVELLARGLGVPKDVAVVGFDDLPVGNLFTVGVTSHAYPSEGLARHAVRLMRDRLADPDRLPVKVVVPGRLVVRESTGGPDEE